MTTWRSILGVLPRCSIETLRLNIGGVHHFVVDCVTCVSSVTNVLLSFRQDWSFSRIFIKQMHQRPQHHFHYSDNILSVTYFHIWQRQIWVGKTLWILLYCVTRRRIIAIIVKGKEQISSSIQTFQLFLDKHDMQLFVLVLTHLI